VPATLIPLFHLQVTTEFVQGVNDLWGETHTLWGEIDVSFVWNMHSRLCKKDNGGYGNEWQAAGGREAVQEWSAHQA